MEFRVTDMEELEELWDIKHQPFDVTGFHQIETMFYDYRFELSISQSLSRLMIYDGKQYRLYYFSWRRNGDSWFEITGKKSNAARAEIFDDMRENHPTLFEWILWHPL